MSRPSSTLFAIVLASVPSTLALADSPPGAPASSPPPAAPPATTGSSSGAAAAVSAAPPPSFPAPVPAPPATAAGSASEASVAGAPAVSAVPAVESAGAAPSAPALVPWLVVAAEVGFQHLAVAALKGTSTSALAVDGSLNGPVLGAAVTILLHPLTLGARARFTHFAGSNYWNVGPEIGVRVPLGAWEPYGFLGAGYASVAGLGSVPLGAPLVANPVSADIASSGYEGRLGAGVDVRVHPHLTLGAVLAAEIVHLSYSVTGAPFEGSTTGLGTSAVFVAGAHFLAVRVVGPQEVRGWDAKRAQSATLRAQYSSRGAWLSDNWLIVVDWIGCAWSWIGSVTGE